MICRVALAERTEHAHRKLSNYNRPAERKQHAKRWSAVSRVEGWVAFVLKTFDIACSFEAKIEVLCSAGIFFRDNRAWATLRYEAQFPSHGIEVFHPTHVIYRQ